MARPSSRTGLNDATQRELVWWLAKGLSKEEAAERAGLPNPRRAYHFARSREFSSALRDGLLEHMSNDLAPKAVKILNEIMSDDKVNPRVRVDAAKALLDRSGYSSTQPGAGGRNDRLLSEMSIPELQRLVNTIEAAQAESARIIDGELIEIVGATTLKVDELLS